MQRRHLCWRAVSVLALAGLLVATGCTTADTLMKHSLARGTADEEQAAAKLAQYAADRNNEVSKRCWALRASSRLKKQPLSAIKRLGQIVADSGDDPTVRRWAAHALGELRRKETIPYFMTALERPIDHVTSYYMLEGLAKLVAVVVQDTRLNDKVLSAMNTYAAQQKKFPPDIYDLLNESVTNLAVLAMMLKRTAAAKGKRVDFLEAYTAIYRTLSFLSLKKKPLLASFKDNEKAISETFKLSFASTKRTHQALLLLIGWYAGILGDNPEFSRYCATRIGQWASSADTRLRLLVVWSLTRMELHQESARQALIARVLHHEKNPKVMRLLGALRTREGQPDKLQELMKVQARNQERN